MKLCQTLLVSFRPPTPKPAAVTKLTNVDRCATTATFLYSEDTSGIRLINETHWVSLKAPKVLSSIPAMCPTFREIDVGVVGILFCRPDRTVEGKEAGRVLLLTDGLTLS